METKTSDVDLRKVLRVLLEHWWWFVVGVVVCVSLAIFNFYRKTPSWATEATIMFRQQEGFGGGQMASLSMLGLTGNQETEDEVIVLSSRGLLYQAIDALNLWDTSTKKVGMRWFGEYPNPTFTVEYINMVRPTDFIPFHILVKQTRKGYRVQIKRGYFVSETIYVNDFNNPIETKEGTLFLHVNRPILKNVTYRVTHSPREVVVTQYRATINIMPAKKKSNVIKLTTRSIMPSRDKALLAKLIELYNKNAIEDKNLIATNTAAFVNERMEIISQELGDAEEALSTYKEQNNIADIETQAKLFLEASSKEQKEILEIETQLSLVDYIDEFLRDETKNNSLIPSNIGLQDASLNSVLGEYNSMLLQRMRIMRTATDTNPVIEQMNAQLSSLRENIIATVGSVRESLKIRKRNMEVQDSKYNRDIKSAPERQRDYLRAARQQKIREQLYVYLYEKREENALMLAATTPPAKILDVPERDLESMSPKLLKKLFMGGMAGVMLPAMLLYLLILLNDKIDDVKSFETRIKAPMLGKLVQNSSNVHIAISDGTSTASAELFRLIRTNLRYIIPSGVQSPVILVTSGINGDGKSYVSSNTALSLAMLGKKVALVGLDVRKPMLATYFDLSTKGHLTDYLAEPDVKLDDIIVPSGMNNNLDIIPCGTIPPNPAELLQTERVDELFAELRKRYDYIIVDTAPLALVSDTYQLDRIADMTIVVFRYKYTPTDMIEYVNNVIEQKRMHNVACVLNGVKGLRAGYGYGYGMQQD